jgi:hypothetical protein
LQTAFRGGVDRFVAPAGESLEAVGAEHGHDRAVFMFAAMVGGLALSRAIRMLTTQVRPIFCEPLRNNSGAWSIADRRLNPARSRICQQFGFCNRGIYAHSQIIQHTVGATAVASLGPKVIES